MGGAKDEGLIREAVALARRLQQRANALQTPAEAEQQAELDRMLDRPEDKATLVQMTDQAFRSRVPSRVADQLTHILDAQGIPRFFSPLDRTLLGGFRSFGAWLPGVAVPLVKEKMQHETANVVLPAEPELLHEHLRARRDEGVRMNLNFLGEALLGEEEAERRLQHYLHALQDGAIEVVSVKISTLFSQISGVAREHTIRTLSNRMELLYRAAARERFERRDGSRVPKLVYMDMEEYRDMSITAETFMRTLDRPGLETVNAGLALQAYLPDSFATQRRVTEWAMARVARGHAPVTLRIVKGANLEMERVEASIRGWPLAPFGEKADTDANYRRMLRYALEPAHASAVRVGVASHNLFELAYAIVLASHNGVGDRVHFEMLEGMANHQRRALFEVTDDLLLYAPACHKRDFVNAIGYMVRRLDENSGERNFLRHAFRLRVDSTEWRALESDFIAAFARIDALPDGSHRRQDRRLPPRHLDAAAPFTNEPDTDFSLPHHAEWAASILARQPDHPAEPALEAPLVIDGEERFEGRAEGESHDPSRPGHVVGRFRVANAADVEDAVACAVADADGWRALDARARGERLRAVARELREARAELMAIALAEGGKVLEESDPEVSEAVDFCELYARSAESFDALPTLEARGRGGVVVVPPWNFPIAIPCGGIAAALAAGNTVILKPAPETVLTAWRLCQCFWRAGVSRRALQFVFGENREAAQQLATHPDVDTVIFTGGTATALHLLSQRPAMRLLAETGGKNAMIVTAMADRDLAIGHAVRSAFGHAGQKCSATSLLILEREVYEDESFRASLCDATRSLRVGSAWEPTTRVGPLIRAPRGALDAALKELDAGEEWALRPRPIGDNPALWSPGIKWGVRPGSRTHTTELFGPVLGVMCAETLDHAIELVHETGYGLTTGLHSLDDREQVKWRERVRAGNLYLDRGTTGAVVLRQPFGGLARSAIGPGLQAGGPNYVASLMHLRDGARATVHPPEDADPRSLTAPVRALLARLEGVVPDAERLRLQAAAHSDAHWMQQEFVREHDHFRLLGQDNLRSYRPIERLCLRVGPGCETEAVLRALLAALAAGAGFECSLPEGFEAPWLAALRSGLTLSEEEAEKEGEAATPALHFEDDDALAARANALERLRWLSSAPISPVLQRAAADGGLCIVAEPPVLEGRVELLHALREQSLSSDYHRYGNLGLRAGEPRASSSAAASLLPAAAPLPG